MTRVWCNRCGVQHDCTFDHGPDGHSGSAVCCPVERAERSAESLARAYVEPGAKDLTVYVLIATPRGECLGTRGVYARLDDAKAYADDCDEGLGFDMTWTEVGALRQWERAHRWTIQEETVR